MKNALGFALAAAICAPKLVVEDTLRAFGVNVPKAGLNYNEQGKSITDIWADAGREAALKESLKAEFLTAMKASGKDALPTLQDLVKAIAK